MVVLLLVTACGGSSDSNHSGGETTSNPTSNDVDADGTTDTESQSTTNTCIDTAPLGDGWGWNGVSSCRVDSISEEVDESEISESIPQSFTASYTGSADLDEDNVDDRYDIDFNGGLDTNQNGVDDIYEVVFRNGVDSNGNGIEDSAENGLASGGRTSVVVRSDGPDTANVVSLFANAWGAVDSHDQNCNGGHAGFGSHVHETYDQIIDAYVFKFIMHAEDDIDCALTEANDRQRLQIVNSGNNPEFLASNPGDWLTYRFNLFIPDELEVNNYTTTFFQLKYFGGSLSEFLFAAHDDINGDANLYYYHHASDDWTERKVLLVEPLHRYTGKWVDVFVRIRSSEVRGVLQVVVRDLSTGNVISEVFEDELDMWREGAYAMKSSYGIYRFTPGRSGTSHALKDEEIYLDSICIAKGSGRCLVR